MSADLPTSALVVRSLLDGGKDTTHPTVALVQVMLSGFGYNFHDPANVARANDQRVRARASEVLGEAAQRVAALEAEFRAARVPPSTREQPLPPAPLLKVLRHLNDLQRHVNELTSRVQALEVPGTDRIWSRLREERALLEELIAADIELVTGAENVLTAMRNLSVAAAEQGPLEPVDALVAQLRETLRRRQSLLG
jgi:hypothetical protein